MALPPVGMAQADNDEPDDATGDDESRGPLGSVLGLWIDRSVYTKVLVGWVLIVAVVGIIGTAAVDATEAATRERTEEDFKHELKVQNKQIETWKKALKERAALVGASDPVVEDGGKEAVDEMITQLNASSSTYRPLPGEVDQIHYVDLNESRVVASTVNATEGTTAEEIGAAWGNVSVSYSRYVVPATSTAPYTPSYRNSKVVAFVAASPKPGRGIVFVVDLGEASGELSNPVGGRTIIVNERGEIVLSTAPNLVGKNAYETGHVTRSLWKNATDETSKMRSRVVTGTLTPSGGKEQFAGAVHVEEENWVIVSQTPTSLVFEITNVVQQFIVYLVGATLVGVVVVFAAVTLPTVVGLKRLKAKAQAVSEGEFGTELTTVRGDEIGSVYRSVDRMRSSLQEKIEEAEAAADRAQQAQEEQEQLLEELTEHVENFSETMSAAADGDLTVRLDEDTDVEQLRTLAADFNEMLEAFEESVDETMEFSRAVATASTEAEAAMTDIREASDNIARAMQEINEGADEQNEQLEQTVEEMNKLASTTEEIASSLNEVSKIAQQTAQTGQDGIDDAREAVQEMEQVDEESASAAEEMDQLLDRMEEIDEIADFIQEVAKETNMLALNANIEASRSGEGGGDGGFDVVAEEIKELSAQARESAEDIDELISEVRQQAQSTADEVERTRERISSSTETVSNTVDAFEDIAEYADQTNQGVQEMNQATQSQAETTQEVVTMVEEASSISEMTAREAEDTAAAAEEQTSSIKEIGDSVADLSERATRLNDLVDQFSVEREAPSTGDGLSGEVEDDATDDGPAAADDQPDETDDRSGDVGWEPAEEDPQSPPEDDD